MRAEVIAIGTELLLGYTVNDDATHVSRALAGLGIDCFRHVTVGDNPVRLKEALLAGLERADLVVTCGGLGPTVDDVTLETIAQVTDRSLLLNRKILQQIQARFRRLKIPMPSSNRRQALIPKGAIPFPNTVGTAPGFLLKTKSVNKCTGEQVNKKSAFTRSRIHSFTHSRILVALPGPPAELIPMLKHQVVPHLRRFSGKTVIRSKTLKTTGLSESEVDAKVRDLLAWKGKITLGIYAHPGQVDLRITAKAATSRKADEEIHRLERQLRHRLGTRIYGADQESLESAVGKLLCSRKKTLSVAESCTGGLIQHCITEIPGSSDYFVGGVVSYENQIKQSLLSIPADLLRKRGAVSAEVAQRMAVGVRELTGSDLGLAVTGIAGPTGGSKAKPVGLAYIALAANRHTITRKFLFNGNRSKIKFVTSQAALNLLRLHLLKKI